MKIGKVLVAFSFRKGAACIREVRKKLGIQMLIVSPVSTEQF